MNGVGTNFGRYQVHISNSVSEKMSDIEFAQGNNYAYPNTAKAVRYLTDEGTVGNINKKLEEGHKLNAYISGADGVGASKIDLQLVKPDGNSSIITWHEHLGTSGDQIFESMHSLKSKLRYMLNLSHGEEATGLMKKIFNLFRKV